jgi:DNA-binding MarR family transcriptional regulator
MKAELEGDDMYSKVLVYIQQNPGCHLRRIKNEIGMSMGSVQYQLFRLEKRGRITSIRSVVCINFIIFLHLMLIFCI